jgi:exonuclease III
MIFKFWNINNSRRAYDLVAQDVATSRLPIIFGFSEYWDINQDITPNEQVYLDHNGRTGLIFTSSIKCEDVRFTRYYSRGIIEVSGVRISVYVVHFMSLIQSEIDAERINANTCRDILTDAKNTNMPYVIMGDFNTIHSNELFDSAFNFNTVSYHDEKGKKVIDGMNYDKLYSPLSSMCNNYNKAHGSYYYNKRTQSQAWHLTDQVLLSPTLSSQVVNVHTGIQNEICGQLLLNGNGRIANEISDHLPIQVYLDESKTSYKELLNDH